MVATAGNERRAEKQQLKSDFLSQNTPQGLSYLQTAKV